LCWANRLCTANGAPVMVVGLRRNVGHAVVYTLTVAKDHTFFVGTAKVLVHNAASGACTRIVLRRVENGDVIGVIEPRSTGTAVFGYGAGEAEFARALLTRKTNIRLFRVDQRLLSGDFVAIDMSARSAAARRVYVIELKQGAPLGVSVGNQFQNARQVVASLGLNLNNLRELTGDASAVLQAIEAGG